MVAVGVVQVTIDEVIDMIPVRHHRMTAVRAVNVASVVAAAIV